MREYSPGARSRRAQSSRRQESSWARRSGEVVTLPLLARVEGQCGSCLLPYAPGEAIAKFVERVQDASWWGHAVCVASARAERPP